MKRALIALTALVAVALPAVAVNGSAASAAAAVHLVGAFPNQGSGNSLGGYLLYSNGKVVPVAGAPYYGNGLSAKVNNFVALVSDSSNPGYWLITSTGKIVAVGALCSADSMTLQGNRVAGTIVGAVNPSGSLDEGFDEVNAAGATSEYQCNF